MIVRIRAEGQYRLPSAQLDRLNRLDNKIVDAKSRKEGDKYVVDITVESKKFYADSTGKETEAPSENYVEIGVYKNKNTIMEINRYKLKNGVTTLSIPVAEKPYKVIVDPRMLLIDKKQDDNEKRTDGGDRKDDAPKKSGVKVQSQS